MVSNTVLTVWEPGKFGQKSQRRCFFCSSDAMDNFRWRTGCFCSHTRSEVHGITAQQDLL